MRAGFNQLQRFGRRFHPLGAFGLNFTQLSLAEQTGPVNAFMIKRISSMWDQSAFFKKGKVYLDAVVTPIPEAGTETAFEACWSCYCASIFCEVKRWRAVRLESSNQKPRIAQGAEARLIQHENEHNQGILIVDQAFAAGNRVYLVWPERLKLFRSADLRGCQEKVGLPLLPAQWRAMRAGEFPPSLN